MAFAVEIALAKATSYDISKLRIRNKQELYHSLTDRETFTRVLEQGLDNKEEYLKYKDKILDYFMRLQDKVKIEELAF